MASELKVRVCEGTPHERLAPCVVNRVHKDGSVFITYDGFCNLIVDRCKIEVSDQAYGKHLFMRT